MIWMKAIRIERLILMDVLPFDHLLYRSPLSASLDHETPGKSNKDSASIVSRQLVYNLNDCESLSQQYLIVMFSSTYQ